MCSAFLKYVMGVGNLSYCQTPLRDVNIEITCNFFASHEVIILFFYF